MKNGVRKFLCCWVIMGLFLFSGCSRKVLKCSSSITSYDEFASANKSLKIIYKNDSIYKLDFSTDFTFSEKTLNLDSNIVDSTLSTAGAEFDYLTGKSGVSYSTSKRDNGFVSRLKINFNKLDADTKKKVHFINYKDSYVAMKKNLENNGYTCK